MKATSLTGYALSLATLLVGCGSEPAACTLLGAAHGLTIAPRAAVLGEYSLSIQSDVVATTCTIQFDQIDQPNAIDLSTCTTERGVVRRGDNSAIELVVSGDYVSGSLPALPASVRIELVKRDTGAMISCRQIEPAYQEHWPNGRECDAEPYRTATEYIGDTAAVTNQAFASNCK